MITDTNQVWITLQIGALTSIVVYLTLTWLMPGRIPCRRLALNSSLGYDPKKTLSQNRLLGLWRLLTGYRLAYTMATLCLAVSALAKTGTFYLLRYLVDEVLMRSELVGRLTWVALGFVLLAGLEGGFTFLSGRLAAATAEGVARRLRNYLFDHIQRLSFTYHDRMQTGELLERSTSDVESLRNFFADQAIGVGRVVSLFGTNLAALINLNPSLALLSIAVVPIIVAMSIVFFRRLHAVYEAYQDQEAKLSTTLQENLTGVRVVKAFARQDFERDKFEKENWAKFRCGKRFFTIHSLYWPVSDVICGLQMLACVWIGALRVMDGSISVGTYVAYINMVLWIIWPMRNLGRLIVQMSTGLVSYGRVIEVIREEREPLDEGDCHPAGALRGEVVFDHVGFGYSAEHRVLEDIDLRCAPGQVVALLGSTGSGKTTLVNLLPRFYDYTSGLLTLDGVDLKRYPRHYLRQQIGIVEQEPFLFSRSIRENVTYGVQRMVSQDEIEAAARAAAIHDDILTFPNGYDTVVGEKGVMLSGGQKQRVAIARTLLRDPRILILDDSTSSVDTETEQEIREALQHLMQGRTTFIIAHRIQSVMSADLILVMDRGRVVQRGTHETLMEQPGTYRQVYDLQASIEVELEKEIACVAK